MSYSLADIRACSIQEAARLGYRINPTLPLLVDAQNPRATDEIVRRALILGAVVAGSIGDFPASILFRWVARQSLTSGLTAAERRYFEGASPTRVELTDLRDQVESLWAMAWVLGKTDVLDFAHVADDALGIMLPDIEADEDCSRFRQFVRIRSAHEIISACDLSYCLHWALVDARRRGEPPPGAVEPYVIVYRRRALEWVLSDEDWDAVSLDT